MQPPHGPAAAIPLPLPLCICDTEIGLSGWVGPWSAHERWMDAVVVDQRSGERIICHAAAKSRPCKYHLAVRPPRTPPERTHPTRMLARRTTMAGAFGARTATITFKSGGEKRLTCPFPVFLSNPSVSNGTEISPKAKNATPA
jgi:hypothetical protein